MSAAASQPAHLVEDDLNTILQEMEGVASEWYGIGLALGMNNNILERISREPGNIKDMFRKMITEWLRMNYDTEKLGHPTWKGIVKAVRAGSGGGNSALANRLAKDHGVLQDTQPGGSGSILRTPRKRSTDTQHGSICDCCCYPKITRDAQLEELSLSISVSLPTREQPHIPRRASGGGKSDPPPGSKMDKSKSLEKSRRPVSGHPTWEIKDLVKQEGYFGPLSSEKAEVNLRQCGGNCYLIRYSEGNKCYVISVLRQDAKPEITDYPLHIHKQDDHHNVYEIEGTQKQFTDVSALLRHFQENPITRSDRNIGKVCKKLLF